jgi:fused signal recognition particle receptor
MPPNRSHPEGFFGRLVAGLARTRQGLRGQIERLFAGDVLDPSTLDSLEESLIAADIGPVMAGRIIAALHQRLNRRELREVRDVEDAVKEEILAVLRATLPPALSAEPDSRPRVFLFLGVNGSGKTTTIGKLAKRLIDSGGRVILAAADTFRAAAIEQLQLWGARVGAEVVSHQPGADPSAVV